LVRTAKTAGMLGYGLSSVMDIVHGTKSGLTDAIFEASMAAELYLQNAETYKKTGLSYQQDGVHLYEKGKELSGKAITKAREFTNKDKTLK
jgi:hypothetical protein